MYSVLQVKQFQKLFQLDGLNLEFEDEALDEVAAQVLAKKTGARGLRAVIEKVLMESQYCITSLRDNGVKSIFVSQDNVANLSQPTQVLTDDTAQI